jgi:serine-type D-Ala-D-Ala carboxypeptidase (penicillin-binding protein 5/6)
MKKIILFLILMFPISVFAEDLNLTAASSILVEESTGKVLYENNADEKRAPASMTKIMTILLVMENIDSGKLKLNDKITISPNAASMGGSQVFLQAGQQMKVNELLKAITIASANDVAVIKKQSQVIGEEIII